MRDPEQVGCYLWAVAVDVLVRGRLNETRFIVLFVWRDPARACWLPGSPWITYLFYSPTRSSIVGVAQRDDVERDLR